MVRDLTAAIGVIGPEFEVFAGTFLDHVMRTPLDHSGLNSLGFPISQVLDSTSDDGKTVAQYSAEKQYFAAGMTKASGDVDKALARRPGATRIILLSNEPKRPIVADDFKKQLLSQPRMAGKSIVIWGATQIAYVIVRRLLFNDAALEELAEYLPQLSAMRDREARDRLFLVPPPGYRPRPDVDREIQHRLQHQSCLIISGMGGCGKSIAAAAYGTGAASYNLKLWLHRDEFTGAAGLQATPLQRGGEKRNIASLLKAGRCLLVIDDPMPEFAEAALGELCGPGSHVIVTVRERRADDYPLPELRPDDAREILQAALIQPCPDPVFSVIWATVGGHPFSLALMNAAVRMGAPWDDIRLDCQAVGEFADRNQRLADRILGRFNALLFDELSVFEWAGQSTCDAGFLRHAIKPLGIRKLQERALTAADLPTATRLHDIVFASLSSLNWWTAGRRSQLDDLLADYLAFVSLADDLRFWAAATSLREVLQQRVAAGDRRPAFLLALLSTVPPDVDVAPELDDPATIAAGAAAASRDILPIEFRLIIESFEWLYRRHKSRDEAQAVAFAESGLPMFDDLAKLQNLSPRQRSEIGHHRGKALQWLKRHGEARLAFEAVLDGDHPLDATRLQLVRSYKAERAFAEAARLGLPLIQSAQNGEVIAPSVLLAAIADLPWQDEATRHAVLEPRYPFFEKVIVHHANAGYDQAYKTLAAAARYWSKEAPDLLVRVLAQIPTPNVEQIQDDEVRSSFADLLLEVAGTQGVEGAATRRTALSFFEATRSPRPFNLQRKAELLIEMGEPKRAEAILSELDTNCWIQRLQAKALLALGKAAAALPLIDGAIADPKGASKLFEFYELRHEIRRALGDTDAIRDLEEAFHRAPAGAQSDRVAGLLAKGRSELPDRVGT